MEIYGEGIVDFELEKPSYFFKAIINREAVAFFSAHLQHRDKKVGGISYEDDYAGNALACIVQNGWLEIRYHKDYSDEEVLILCETFLQDSRIRKLKWFNIWQIQKASE